MSDDLPPEQQAGLQALRKALDLQQAAIACRASLQAAYARVEALQADVRAGVPVLPAEAAAAVAEAQRWEKEQQDLDAQVRALETEASAINRNIIGKVRNRLTRRALIARAGSMPGGKA